MGTTSLHTSLTNPPNNGRLRIYAHCNRNTPTSKVTLAVVNLSNKSCTVQIAGAPSQRTHEQSANITAELYWLSPYPATAGLLASGVALNGRPLEVSGSGPWEMPSLAPIEVTLVSSDLHVPALTYGFVTVNDIVLSVCT